jgi:hypothetical protein
MIPEEADYATVEAMVRYGGSFVKALGQAWYAADSDNKSRLRAAFPEYWKQYADIATQMKTRT